MMRNTPLSAGDHAGLRGHGCGALRTCNSAVICRIRHGQTPDMVVRDSGGKPWTTSEMASAQGRIRGTRHDVKGRCRTHSCAEDEGPRRSRQNDLDARARTRFGVPAGGEAHANIAKKSASAPSRASLMHHLMRPPENPDEFDARNAANRGVPTARTVRAHRSFTGASCC